jgi:hypothetical protein
MTWSLICRISPATARLILNALPVSIVGLMTSRVSRAFVSRDNSTDALATLDEWQGWQLPYGLGSCEFAAVLHTTIEVHSSPRYNHQRSSEVRRYVHWSGEKVTCGRLSSS